MSGDLDSQKYSPPTSLWSLVLDQTPTHERDEIKRLLGYSLVEQSLELQSEVALLLEIWRDYRQEGGFTSSLPSRLPEPPDIRNRLKKEIKFFVDCIREKSKSSGWCAEDIIAKQKQNILQYALYEQDDSSHSVSVIRESDGRETPARPHSSDSSGSKLIQSRLQVVQLDAENIDAILQHLRRVLSEEVACLLDDITFLQNCLEGEVKPSTAEPSLNELREQRSKLEKELLSHSLVSQQKTLNKHSSPDLSLQNRNSNKSNVMKPSVKTGLKPSSHIPSPPDKRKPMKAVHSPCTNTSSVSQKSVAPNKSTSVSSQPTKLINSYDSSKSSLNPKSSTQASAYNSGDSKLSQDYKTTDLHPISTLDHDRGDHLVEASHGISSTSDMVDEARSYIRAAGRSASPSHVFIRTNSKDSQLISAAKQLATPPAAKLSLQQLATPPAAKLSLQQLPSPPSSASRRGGAAQRFRNMVLECRDSTT